MPEPTLKSVMAELKANGNPKTVATYRRHGVRTPIFGVSSAKLNEMAKKLKNRHDLARELWATGNGDARNLATLVADPEKLTREEADLWAGDLDNRGLAGYFTTKLLARAPFAAEKAKQWIASGGEYQAYCGWSVLGILSMNGAEVPEAESEARLAEIERRIRSAPNRAREAMNSALVVIGMRSPALREKALAAAKRIGPVEIDHGDTDCKTLDAVAALSGSYADKGMRRMAAKRKPR